MTFGWGLTFRESLNKHTNRNLVLLLRALQIQHLLLRSLRASLRANSSAAPPGEGREEKSSTFENRFQFFVYSHNTGRIVIVVAPLVQEGDLHEDVTSIACYYAGGDGRELVKQANEHISQDGYRVQSRFGTTGPEGGPFLSAGNVV